MEKISKINDVKQNEKDPFINLRDVIDLAKRVLTKEKLDRQLTGQTSTPFMKATNNDSSSTQNNPKRGVTFDVMET